MKSTERRLIDWKTNATDIPINPFQVENSSAQKTSIVELPFGQASSPTIPGKDSFVKSIRLSSEQIENLFVIYAIVSFNWEEANRMPSGETNRLHG